MNQMKQNEANDEDKWSKPRDLKTSRSSPTGSGKNQFDLYLNSRKWLQLYRWFVFSSQQKRFSLHLKYKYFKYILIYF